MMRARDKRLSRLKNAIAEAPVRRHLLREAYEWFTASGELPEDDDHLAAEVVQQAMRGGEERPLAHLDARGRRVPVDDVPIGDDSFPPSVRGMLFGEALRAQPPLRGIARAAIAVEVGYGGDVESPAFGARYGIPMYGSMAMHMLGWDSRLVRPPYEFQATRLLVRFDNIRGRIPQDAPRWLDDLANAIATFKQAGRLPNDDIMIEAVLVHVELDQLTAHKRSKDVSEAMALFNAVQWKDGDEQQEALQQLCAMAADGRLF